jgi:DeoR family fructose operon transcriptional repressor
MIKRAERVVALVDHSKFGNVQMFGFASFDEIDVLITDSGADPEVVDFVATHDITVHCA